MERVSEGERYEKKKEGDGRKRGWREERSYNSMTNHVNRRDNIGFQ